MEETLETTELTKKIVSILEDHKAEEIVLMDVHKETDIADYFIICNGTSDRMLDALANAVIDEIRDAYHIHGHQQGIASGGWMLIDFGEIIVHIFSPDRRDYYKLEDLYQKSKILLKMQ